MEEEKKDISSDSEKETLQEPPQGKPPRYSVVFRFWSSYQEVGVDDIILCQDTYTHEYYYQFFDIDGRLWKNVPKNDLILIENFPGKKSIERYSEIKKQISEYEKEELKCKPQEIDVNIG